MAKENGSNKIITIALAIIITFAAIAIIYVNLPEGTKTTDDTDDETQDETEDEEEPEDVILTITYESEIYEYSLSDLEDMESYIGSGSYIKTKALPEVIINGPYTFTGIKFTTLMDQIDDIPKNYNITVTATDGWNSEYTMSQINGNVDTYNETGNITEGDTVIMILAYKEDGEYITDEEIGPLRIAFLGEDVITASNLWSKMVESIEIVEV